MKTFKYIAAFLLTAVLVVTGAFLPTLASAVYDASSLGQVHHTDIEKLDLSFEEEKDGFSTIERLYIMLFGQSAELTENFFIPDIKMSRDARDIPDISLSALEPYFTMGFFSGFEDFIKTSLSRAEQRQADNTARLPDAAPMGSTSKGGSEPAGEEEVESEAYIVPTVYYIPGNAAAHFTAWLVSINGVGTHLSLFLDDETGVLLDIDYYSEKMPLDSKRQHELLEIFCDIFFDAIGESETLQYYRDNGLLENMYDDGMQESFTNTGYRFTFGDVVYGQLALYLEVFERGFRTMRSYA